MSRAKGLFRVRTIYINAKGEMYLQFYPERQDELKQISQECFHVENLQCGYKIEGIVNRITQSGIVMKTWRLV